MKQYKVDFIRLLLNSGALKLENPDDPEGLFTLKSGRRSPFFMNMGDLNTGNALAVLGGAYAATAYQNFEDEIDIFFGPAYKGIPLVAVTSTFFGLNYDTETRYCSNRKEIKDHGDGGILLGAKPQKGDRIVIIEDVTTSGKSLEETIPILKAQEPDVDIKGLVVAFDRMEYGHDKTKTALEEVGEKYNMETHAIVSIADVLEFMNERRQLAPETMERFKAYYAEYGPEGSKVC